MTSTTRISGTGLKKWKNPVTRSGRSQPAAIAVIDSDDVLDARMQRSLTTVSKSRSSSRLMSRFSTMASITASQSDTCRRTAHRARECRVRVGFLDLALGGEFGERVRQILARGGERFRIRVEQIHGGTGASAAICAMPSVSMLKSCVLMVRVDPFR